MVFGVGKSSKKRESEAVQWTCFDSWVFPKIGGKPPNGW